jgi:hypothetical protein
MASAELLRVRFDARSHHLLRLRHPLPPPAGLATARFPQLGAVYQQAYENGVQLAVQYDLPDDPSTLGVPPEFDEFPIGEAWRRGISDGGTFGRLLRQSILEALARDDAVQS